MFKDNISTGNVVKALVGGFLGTLAFTLMGKFLAPHLIGHSMDVAAIIAHMLGTSESIGLMMHFMVGTIVFPIGYLLIGYSRLPGSGWQRGLLFLIPIYLIAMTVVIPMAGKGLFFHSMPMSMVALMGHMVYGIILGAIVGTPKKNNA
ncbi:DUF6789 family protein [Photobacterium phosphoreum]|uniref:DUF6789 family protein n=1 Tax=Photobacterium phosphoreum TaxID=659 RepID=UPI0007F8852B|nr:DUF6789 family protein [Photobacterium phosphoreum]MCD9510270.1 hypothetical protein [Photobacterium phosphoreum]OBU37447.1 hypothetical protein AYY24_11535 [Photobacterium phosphoreum]PSW37999.1 hypothetical protein CTM87_05475 [Photobacterium phosphoreum]